jgi:hypothetical protein
MICHVDKVSICKIHAEVIVGQINSFLKNPFDFNLNIALNGSSA